jgi:hypothetical protein
MYECCYTILRYWYKEQGTMLAHTSIASTTPCHTRSHLATKLVPAMEWRIYVVQPARVVVINNHNNCISSISNILYILYWLFIHMYLKRCQEFRIISIFFILKTIICTVHYNKDTGSRKPQRYFTSPGMMMGLFHNENQTMSDNLH